MQSSGGQANGTTHQDYTDYYQVASAAALERTLFREADRMRAPRFTPEGLAQQLEGIDGEIHQAVTARPYGGFPRPLLPQALFRTFANAHDGYGQVDALRTITVDDCAEFFESYYAPGNAVLTIVGDFETNHAAELIERHFGDIPARAVIDPPDLSEPLPSKDRWLRCTEPNVPATALAVAYRLPDPASALTDYLAYFVLSRLLIGRGMAAGLPAPSTSCGFFGPLDALEPDALFVTSLLPPDLSPERAVAAIGAQWAELSRPDAAAVADAVEVTVRCMVAEHHRHHGDVQTRARALGRLELLFGRAELLDEIPAIRGGIGAVRVAEAARVLATAPKAVLLMEPGEPRTRPDPVRADEAAGADNRPGVPGFRNAALLASSPGGPRPLPAVGRRPGPRLSARADVVTAGGLRVVVVEDTRVPLVELRLRLPLGPTGCDRPDDVDRLALWLGRQCRVAARATLLGGTFELSADGQWLDASGYVPPRATEEWLRLLADVVTLPVPDEAVGALAAIPARRTPIQEMEAALRRSRLTGSHGGSTKASFHALRREVMVARGGSLTAVGDIDPARLVATAERVLSGWSDASLEVPGPAPFGWDDGPLVVRSPGGPDIFLTLCGPEPAGDTGDPARYLATAIFGGYHGSRLAERCEDVFAAGYEVSSGRDVFLGTDRVYVRARVSKETAAPLLAGVGDVLRAMTLNPPRRAEVRDASEFCAGQLLGVFDSPSALADMVRHAVSSGRGPEWVESLPESLGAAATKRGAARVAEAAADLFAGCSRMVVVRGDVDDDWAKSTLAMLESQP